MNQMINLRDQEIISLQNDSRELQIQIDEKRKEIEQMEQQYDKKTTQVKEMETLAQLQNLKKMS